MSELLVEVSAGSSGDLSARPGSPEPFASRADELAAGIAEIAARLRRRWDANFQTGNADPLALDRLELRFDVSLAVDSGLLIAKTGGTGTFTVRMLWQPRQPALLPPDQPGAE